MNQSLTTNFNKDKLLFSFVAVTAIFSAIFNLICYLIAYKSGSIIMAIDLFLFLIIMIMIKRSKLSHFYLSHLYLANCTITVACLSIFHSGGIYSPFLITYIMLSLITVLLFGRSKASWFWISVFLLIIIFIGFSDHANLGLENQYNESYKVFFYTTCLLGVPLCTFLIATVFEKENETSFRLLKENQALLISNEEKDLLIKEIHHRVKNNLQIICSLVNLQIDEVNDKKTIEILNVTRNRIYALSLIHQKLFTGNNTGTVDFKGHLRDLIISQMDAFPEVDYSIEGESVNLNLDQATPLSLIASELIMNSFKHAFSKTPDPKLRIQIKNIAGKKYDLEISDNGCGLPASFDLDKTTTLGMEIIKALTKQIDGEINYNSSENGTTFKIRFDA